MCENDNTTKAWSQAALTREQSSKELLVRTDSLLAPVRMV